MLVATAFASLVEQRGGREGGTGGAESDMEMICHSGAEIISPRSGKSVRNQIQRFVSQMTQPPNYFISHHMPLIHYIVFVPKLSSHPFHAHCCQMCILHMSGQMCKLL